MHDASLATLSDDELHVAVRRLTARSNIVLADLLAHLGEVEARGIHRNRACASLYTYCIYELRMSEDAAFRRSKAARVVHRHPELRQIVARGEIHLTGLLMIAPLLGGERHTEVLERARFRSKREIARLIAELDPKPEVPARIDPVAPALRSLPPSAIAEAFAGPIRELPPGDRPADWIEPSDPGESSSVPGPDVADAEAALEGAWLAARTAQTDRPLRFRVQFTASQEYVDLLEEAFELLGFGKNASSLPDVQLRALRELVEQLRKQKGGPPARRERKSPAPARAAHTMERAETPSPAPARAADRQVPVAVRRAVWTRDGSQCAYTDERGQRCAERRGLELHHRKPYARGGLATEDNLELRCRAHNGLAAEEDFGWEHMARRRGSLEAGPLRTVP